MPTCSTASHRSEMHDEETPCSEASRAIQAVVPAADALVVTTPPASSEADEQAEYSDLDEEETEAPASPTSTRKRRTRRRRRHGKNKVATSTASTASGGNSRSEDEDADGKSPGDRGVVTWRNLGLDLGLGSSKAAASNSPVPRSEKPALARCGNSGSGKPSPSVPPPPINPPELLRDASERAVPPSPFGGQQSGGHWFAVADAGIGISSAHSGWGASWNNVEPPTISVPSSPWGMPGMPATPIASNQLGATPDHFCMPGFASCPCSPTSSSMLTAPSAPAPTPSAGSGKEVPSWLRGDDMPIGGEDLAERLRAVAPDAYED